MVALLSNICQSWRLNCKHPGSCTAWAAVASLTFAHGQLASAHLYCIPFLQHGIIPLHVHGMWHFHRSCIEGVVYKVLLDLCFNGSELPIWCDVCVISSRNTNTNTIRNNRSYWCWTNGSTVWKYVNHLDCYCRSRFFLSISQTRQCDRIHFAFNILYLQHIFCDKEIEGEKKAADFL